MKNEESKYDKYDIHITFQAIKAFILGTLVGGAIIYFLIK